MGIRKHVIESREPLLINERSTERAIEYGQAGAIQGEAAKSTAWAPLLVGGEATGVISLQNLDREFAFSDSDVRVLTTLAASLSVSLENARLIHETRQRVTELGTVNEIGHAVASQFDLDRMYELVGDLMRDTFAADLVYVAMHDRESDRIVFPYYSENGKYLVQEGFPYGQGLTSHIVRTREPLLLNRDEDFEAFGNRGVGTPVKSFLGVPILVSDGAIGVISVQSTEAEGRFGPADARLLATIAANVGIAIQNARLLREARRRADEMAALADIARDISATLDLTGVLEQMTERTLSLLDGDSSAVYLAEPDGQSFRAIVARGAIADELAADVIPLGEGIIGGSAASREPEMVNNVWADPRAVAIPGTEKDVEERLLAAPLIARDTVIGLMAVWRQSPGPPVHGGRPVVLRRARAAGDDRDRERPVLYGGPRGPPRGRGRQSGQEHVPGGDEPRDPDPDERDHRHERPAARHTARHRAARVRGDDRDLRRRPPHRHQRHPRLLQDRGRQGRARHAAHRPPPHGRGRAGPAAGRPPPRGSSSCTRSTTRCRRASSATPGGCGRSSSTCCRTPSSSRRGRGRAAAGRPPDRHAAGRSARRWEITVDRARHRDRDPAEAMGRLFRSFSQVDVSISRRFGGTGLGLAISRRLAELMDGTLTAESSGVPGEGAPSASAIQVDEATLPTPAAEPDPVAIAGRTVLVVDDNATNLRIMATQLGRWQMVVRATPSANEALGWVRGKGEIDLAILDVHMAEMDGVALAGQIRSSVRRRRSPSCWCRRSVPATVTSRSWRRS